MKIRTPRLPLLFALQFLVTLCIPLFLHDGVQALQQHQHLPAYFLPLQLAALPLNAFLHSRINKQMDEYACAALRKAEASCFPWFQMWLILCCLPTMLGYGNGGYTTVYMLGWACPAFMLLRAVLFWWYDRNGLE